MDRTSDDFIYGRINIIQQKDDDATAISNDDIDLSDTYTDTLVNKGTELGIKLDVIKEVLLSFPNKRPPNEADFFEQLIKHAFEVREEENSLTENQTSLQQSSIYSIPNYTVSYESKPKQKSCAVKQMNNKPINCQSTNAHINTSELLNDKIPVQKYTSNEMQKSNNLRPIVIDGDNVGTCEDGNSFLCERIKFAVDYFQKIGHQVYVTKKPFAEHLDHDPILDELKKNNILHYIPNKINPDNNLAILKFAADRRAIVISNDEFTKYQNTAEYKSFILEKILTYTIIDKTFLLCQNRSGKHGPSLENILKLESCPYGLKCTYGSKCKYYHPERGLQQHKYKTAHQSTLDDRQEAKIQLEKEQNEQRLNKNRNTNNNAQYLATNKITRTKLYNSVEQRKPDKLLNEFSNNLNCSSLDLILTSDNKCKSFVPTKDTFPRDNSFHIKARSLQKNNPALESNKQQKNSIPSTPWSTNNLTAASNYQYFPNETNQNSLVNSLRTNDATNASRQDLYSRLCIHLKNEEKAKEIMGRYPDETDEEKLIYLVSDSDFFN